MSTKFNIVGGALLVFILVCTGSSFAQAVEICNDGKDNNGDGKIDCLDSFCNFAPAIEKGCNCFDTKDNDGDGKIDAADTDCATYYGLTFVGSGSTCSIQPPAGTGFSSIAPPQTSSQNTADTPAKVVVGDMNNDGVPDIAVCSKWNSTLQIIATAPASGFATGDIMSDFTTPGSKIFPKAGSNYVFEHEVLIADINKDKIGEVFAIASERGGSPNNAPVRFFLTGFSYKAGKGNLNPLFDAVDLGTDRPGNPGIADFDGDGKSEVYLKNRIYAAESGALLANPGGNWDTEINSGPVAVNILGDNKLELACGNFIYSVPSLASRTLQTLTVAKDMNTLGTPKFYPKGFFDPTEYGDDQASTTSTADFDGDGFVDVLITGAINCSGLEASPCGTNITTIFYWNVQKGTVSTYTPPDPSKAVGWTYGSGRINLGDANGDGKLEALFIAGNQLFCLGLDAGGNLTLLWKRTINDSLSGILSLTIYDFNNDGKPEVVYRDSQELVVIDGPTGQTKIWSAACQSHTWTEGPVVADVNGDGNTDICTTCYTSTAFDPLKNTVQQQSLGQTRLYFSTTNAWLPTRKVWNQHPYYITNIKDDLTLPFPQIDPSLVFSNSPCPNGLPGPQRPLNLFMNQVPRLSKDGCPEFPAPDLTFTGDSPSPTGVDTDGDGVYKPAVVVIPPICGDLNISAYFNIINNGDLPISDAVPVSFFDGDPTVNPVTATLLYKTTLTITNLQVGQKLVTPTLTFAGPGTTFKLYIILYNDGSVLPISLVGQSTKECTISNNIYSVDVIPDPFSATVEKIADNFKCANSAPDNGQLRAHIFKGTTEVTDYSPYAFQWYTGATTASPIPAPAGTAYNLTDRAEGTYTLVVTNIQKGCSSLPVSMTLVRQGNDPDVIINVISNQTKCTPPNGQLEAVIATGNTGYAFEWFDITLTPLGITGPQANGLTAGSYVVLVKKDGCTKTSSPATVNGPQIPDAIAQVLQNVVDCSNPQSGSVQADAVFNGVVQNPANYSFNWYVYNNSTSTRGSILPAANGTGPIRTGLAAGYYQAEVKDNATQCTSGVFPVVQVLTQTVIPTAQITQVAPQTSCDPVNPNGILIGNALVGGVVQNPSTITYQWFKGQNTLPANLVATVSGTNGQIVNKVAGGGIPYTLKITTALNCSSTTDFTIAENLINPVLNITTLPNTVCDPLLGSVSYSGSVTGTVSFAGSPIALPDNNYKFTWYKGTATTDPVIAVADNKQPTLAALKEGDYTVMVERIDLACKSTPQTKPVAKATVLPDLALSSTGSNNCDPALTPDGTATAAINNPGTDQFIYKWFNGNSIASPALTTGANSNNGDQPTAIKLGGPVSAPYPYTVLVTNKTTGCQNNSTIFVADVSVVPVLSFISIVPNSICSPATNFNGSLTTQVDNIPAGYTITDYTFKWYNGNSNGAPTNATSTTALLNKLDAGFYTVDAKNTKTGCQSAPITNQVPNAKIFPSLIPIVTGSNNCDPLLTPDGTATATVSNAGGGDVFSYQWYSGNSVAVGNELLAVNNGTSVTAIKLGGPVGAPKPYTVQVTNINTGCFNSTTTAVPDNSVVPVLSFISVVPNSICSPATSFNGSLIAQVNNIPSGYTVADYVFKWYNGNTNASPVNATSANSLLDKLDAGFYTVDTRNTKTGCQSSPVTDQVPDLKKYPVIQLATTGSHNCDVTKVADGTATATITNAIGGETFTYLWTAVAPTTAITVATNKADQATAIKLGGPVNAPNRYNVLVTNNANGCQSNSQGLVADVSVKPTIILTPSANTICSITVSGGPTAFDGHVDVTEVDYNGVPYAGISTLTYKWFDVDATTAALTANTTSPTNTASSLTKLDNAKYAATVTINDLGCTSDPIVSEVLDNLAPINIVSDIQPSTNCSPAKPGNGKAAISAPLGVNFAYQWYDGATVDPLQIRTETIAVLGTAIQGTNTFTIEVTNKTDGCRNNLPMTVVDAKVIPTITVAVVKNNTICDLATIAPDGELLATVSLGSNFTINWTGGVSPAAIAGANGEQFAKLKAGAYSATVTDDITGCVSNSDGQSIIDNLTYPVIAVTVTDQTTCSGTPNGKLVALADGSANAATHDFVWHDGVGLTGAIHAQNGTGIIDALASSDYTFLVTRKITGCASSQVKFVPENITYPGISFSNVIPVTVCSPTPNGAATPVLVNLTAAPNPDFRIYYTYTFTGEAYPTDPAVIKSSSDTYNSTSAIILGTNPPVRSNMAPGYITALVVDNNTQCESNPFTQQILDNTSQNVITVNGETQAGFCGGVGGGIDISVTGGIGAYTYSWVHSTPINSNINFFNNPPAFATGVVAATEDLGMPGTAPGVDAGVYTVVVRDANGCGAYFVDNVPFANAPAIVVTPTDITKCVAPFDGQVAVNVTGVSATGYTIQIFNGNSTTGSSIVGPTAITPVAVNLSTPATIPKGDYYVQVIDNTPANIACPLGRQVTLKQLALPPTITIDQIDPNTSCTPGLSADGKITLTVTNDPLDLIVGPKDYQISSISPLPVGGAVPIAVGVSGTQVGPITGFEPQSYTITVVDINSQCSIDKAITIPDVQDVPSLLNLVLIPETGCAPLSNGSAVANLVGGEPTTQFDFDWFKNNDATGSVTGAVAGDGTATGGELLNQSKVVVPADWAMGTTGLGSGNRIFYVQGIKNATAPTGEGCKTELKQVVIVDQHVSPDMDLTPAFNSFCSAIAGGIPGDGKIDIVADADPATGGNQNAAGGFDYAWTNANVALTSPQLTQSNIFIIPQLGTGTYQITATNATNKCNVVNSAIVSPAPYVITVNSSAIIDQRICNPDGQIDLTQITVDRSADASAPGNIVETNLTPLTSNYNFKWYKANPLTPGTFNSAPGQELQDGTLAPINNQSLINGVGAGQFATMGAGTYYVVATRRNSATVAAGCPALPYRVNVDDVHKNPVPELTVFSNTSCLPGTDEGEIKINVTDNTPSLFAPGGFSYTYTWSGPAPIPTPSPGNGDGDGSSLDGDDDHYTQLIDDPNPYIVTIVNDQSGCKVNASATVIKNATPVFVQNVTVTDQVLCGPDGSMTVAKVSLNDRNGVSQVFDTSTTPNISDFQFEWTRGAIAFTQTTPGTALNSTNYNATGAGFGVPIGAATYTVTARRMAGGPGAGCTSAPFQVVIQDKRIFPVVSITPFANTSCDPGFFEGELRVKVTDASVNLPAPLTGSPYQFNYTWTTAVTPIGASLNNDGDGFGGGETDAGSVVDNDQDHPVALQEGDYAIQVTNTQTGCQSIGSTKIFRNSTPVFTQLVTPTDQVLCSADGKLVVNEVRVIDRNGVTQSSLTDFPIGDFDFTYARTTQGNTVPGGITGTQLNNINYPAIGADTYFVVATRRSGAPGKDCSSAPYKVDILNKQIFPVASLTPLANTSCDPGFFEGGIRVKVVDNSINIPSPLAGPPFSYNYTWTTAATPIGPTLGSDGDNFGGGDTDAGNTIDNDGDHPAGLQEGAYTLQITNSQTSCISVATTTIFRNSTPVFIPDITSLPQVLCTSDGQLKINQVDITDRNGVTQNAPLTDFDYLWSRTAVGNLVATTNGINGAVSGGTILDRNAYNLIGTDSYFVVAKRVSGAPGKDCLSAPFKVDIDDQRKYPTATFTSVTNSSCSTLKPNGALTTFAAEQNGTNTGPYTFAWTLNSGALSPATIQSNTTNSSLLANAIDGNYGMVTTNTITGCQFATGYNLLLDQTKSTPNVIDVNTIDPLDCNPSASATVTKITLGSQTHSVLFPPNIPPNNEITGAALNTFIYEWSSGIPSNIITGAVASSINNLSVGNYFVVVQDPSTDCKSGPKEVVINDDNVIYPVAEIMQTAKQISCISTVGTAGLAATGDGQSGVPYSFTWFPSLDGTGTQINAVSTAALNNLQIGNYSVVVLNTVTNCTAKAAYVVPDDAPFYTPIVSLGGQPRTLCVGQDGAILARVVNLDPTYPFTLNYTADLYIGGAPNLTNPADIPNIPKIPGFQANFIQSNLSEGTYTVRITDNNTGCIGVATEQVQDKRIPPIVVIIEDNPLTICDPLKPNGQLSATGDGKVGGYTFDWYTGTSVSTPPGALLTSNNKLIGRAAGSYSVRVTNDITGCATDQAGTITDKTIKPPVPAALVLYHRTSCIAPNGWVTATVGGVTLNYTFQWYDGSAIKPAIDFSGVDYQNRDVGPYTVTAMDMVTGCVSPPAIINVLDKRVNPEFTFQSTPSYCLDTGKPKGIGSVQLSLTNSGDVLLADVQWFEITSNANVGSGVQVYELFPGFYRAEAITNEGCVNEGIAEVKTDISPYNGISANGDSQNDFFIIDCITNFPNNNVKIFNRSGILVYEIDGYDNADFSFKGFGKEGVYLQGKELPVGTYFYIIDKRDGSKPVAGYLELDR